MLLSAGEWIEGAPFWSPVRVSFKRAMNEEERVLILVRFNSKRYLTKWLIEEEEQSFRVI